MSLFMVAAALLVLLGMSALAIDLGMLYVARSEAQRAADGAALGGATSFITSGFTSGFIDQATAQTWARQQAIAIGAENDVMGQPADIRDADVTFDFSVPENPRITVVVQRTTARSNAVPTLFARALGVVEADISATATAEAYNPSGSGVPIGTGCVKPWILPNCDPGHDDATNTMCSDSNGNGIPQANFVDPDTGAILNPGSISSGGVIGTLMGLKPGRPQDAPAPSQFYPIQIPPGDEPELCPACEDRSIGSEGPGASLYRHNIACCNTNRLVCGQVLDVNTSVLQTGNMVGPTQQGVMCLIHQTDSNCAASVETCGQDYISDPTVAPFPIMGGLNNPNPALSGLRITSSDSIVTVPLYDGHVLCPGGSCGGTVTIVGFLQVFLRKVGPPQATVDAYIMNVAGCGSGGSGTGGGGTGGGSGSGSGSGGPVIGPGGTLFPIRLVRPGT